MNISAKRAEYLSVAATVLSVVFFLVCFVNGSYSQSFALRALSWQILGQVFIWLPLIVLFHNKHLADQEKLDVSLLEKQRDKSALFEGNEEKQLLLNVAQDRLKSFEKWALPFFGLIVAIYEISIGAYLFKGASAQVDIIKFPMPVASITVAIAFVSFLISRFATGMSTETIWKPLKSGGSRLLLFALLAFILSVAFILSFWHMDRFLKIMAWIVPASMLITGLETAVNLVLDIYRPRIKGQYHMPAFDSRILSVINEPGGILYTAAHTIDYQFGFKVSQTWFYKLLEKAIIPLIILLFAVVYLMSCIVVVGPGEQAIVEHFGSINNESGGKVFDSGLHFKWPWPIDVARKYSTEEIRQVNIGYSGAATKEALIWGKQHFENEYKLMFASDLDDANLDQTGGVPISYLIAAVPVQYKIKDLRSYLYQHSNADELFESICYRELVKFAASVKVEVSKNSKELHDESILGAGRAKAVKTLTDRIQAKSDESNLGIEVVFVGLQNVHPPVEVSAEYQEVIAAVQGKQAEVLDAIAQRNMTLTELGGSISKVDQIYAIAQKYQKDKNTMTPEELTTLEKQLDTKFSDASGEIFRILSEAKSYAFKKSAVAKATGQRFQSQVKANQASPQIYKQQQRLSMLEDVLVGIRKYVVVSDDNDSEVMIIDLQESLTPSLYDMDSTQEIN